MFHRIAIVGCGLIGGSVALAVRAAWPACRLVAIDRGTVVEAARRRRVADEGGEDLALADGADLIVLAAPVRQNIALLQDLVTVVHGTAIVHDVGSTKRAIVEAARSLPPRLRFVGGHPLAGAATGGVEAARADLFQGRPWILTPSAACDHADVDRLMKTAAAVGALPRTMDPDAHDRLMAYLSHLPQLAVSALMQVVGERAGSDGLSLAGSGLRDTTRLASSPSGTWRDVTATNAEALGAAIDDLTAALQRLKADLTVGDDLRRIFDDAAKWKRTLDGSDAGGRSEP